ncbi:GcrA cell cycle regulator [Roseomonas sp. NAR14]|uniref:GcrA cell cycle regulator n=1 Tax=Roseomonas acroporae TaxID=2937791 RepID=A0A9X1Y4P6_9PROT|nr:GcrA family cell cycle regulator [Roseomonas acroporae]MCK8783218.1 GcrA cell cycle regulator [Roseomonas acroporae]
MDWTAEAIERLRALWAEGHSTAEIGRRMGVSKNAVVGKAHRLNLPPRPSPIHREGSAEPGVEGVPARRLPAPRSTAPRAPAQAAAEAPRAAVPPPPEPAAPAPAPMPAAAPARPAAAAPAAVVRPFQRLGARTCCWPLGEPGTPEFRFCGSEAIAGKPYCATHASLAYVKARDRREDAA